MQSIFKWLAAAALAALILTAAAPQVTTAANLSGGNTAYVLNGEEVTFPFDPIRLQNGLLIPVEVFQRVGIAVEGALGRNFTLKKADVNVRITLGTRAADVNGLTVAAAVSPMRLNGRLFLPADLLKYFGVDHALDGSFMILQEYVPGAPELKQTSQADYDGFLRNRQFSASVRLDSNIHASGDFTMLTPDIASAVQFAVDYGTRARIQNLLRTNTLVMVTLRNTAGKAGSLQTSGLFLVDDLRNQYDLVTVLDIGGGLLSDRLAPGADRTGILVFPRVRSDSTMLSLYYDPNGASLGLFFR